MDSTGVTRIGVLVPAGNTVHAAEFERLRPAGVAFRVEGFGFPAAQADFCQAFRHALAAPLKDLRAWGAEVVLLGCTTASMVCDGEGLAASLEASAGVPVVTAATASRAALSALGVQAVCVASPYGSANNGVVADFLTAAGLGVEGMAGLDLDRSPEVWRAEAPRLTGEQAAALALSVDRPAAHALYLPCTGMPSLEAIERFEAETGKPAVSSVQAGFWASLRRVGVDGRQAGAGRLIARWDP